MNTAKPETVTTELEAWNSTYPSVTIEKTEEITTDGKVVSSNLRLKDIAGQIPEYAKRTLIAEFSKACSALGTYSFERTNKASDFIAATSGRGVLWVIPQAGVWK